MQFRFWIPFRCEAMILWRIGGRRCGRRSTRRRDRADLFRARLDQIINMKHELVQLAGKIDWDWIDGEIAPLYSDKGRPGIETRFVIGLLLLKHIYGLSDEGVCERWVHDPYFQHFTGEEFFQHEFPHERSDLSHWRKRLGDKLELLLAESLRVAHASGALRTRDLKRVTVDTTVQPKAITFPTDAKLLHAAIKGLNRLASKHGVRLRQSYLRIAKRAAMMAGRYAHAKQFNRHRRRAAHPAHPARPDHPRHPPQDRGPGQSSRRRSHWPLVARLTDPLAAAAPARLEALFLPCPGGRMHRQGQGQRALRVRRQGLHRHHQCPRARRPVRAACQGAARQSLRRPHPAQPSSTDTEKLTGCEIERAYVDKGYRGHDARKSTPRLHLRTEARRLRRHQARAATPLRHRSPSSAT